MKHFLVLVTAAIFAAICSLSFSGCGNRTGPQVFTFNYAIRTFQDANEVSSVISSIRNGSRTMSDYAILSCNFTADFSVTTPPEIFVYGNPGQIGFNMNIVSTNPVTITTTNPPNCNTLDEIEINIGRRTEALAVGASTNYTNGRLWFSDGRRFGASVYFQAQLNDFNATTRRSTGTFKFVNRLPGSNTLLFVDGSFALTP